MAMTENQEMASAKVLHIAIGTLAGVAVIAIICAVVLALFCRRRHQQDESQTVAKSVANGVLGEESRCTPSAPTANPVYAVSCDIMNDYETTRHVRPQSAEFHSYVPVLPPRRRDREGNRSSGTYEEIQVARDEGDGKSATVAGSDHVTKPNGDYEVYGNAGYEDGDPDGNIQKHAPEEVSAYLTLVPNR